MLRSDRSKRLPIVEIEHNPQLHIVAVDALPYASCHDEENAQSRESDQIPRYWDVCPEVFFHGQGVRDLIRS